MISLLLPAFAISIVLLGIHSFFGLQIIRRGIIFTDLAIGQMAALGAAVSLLTLEGVAVYPLSLGFALLGGLIIYLAGRFTDHLEAVIGLLYALGISAIFILLSTSPHGLEEFKNLMAYDILYTSRMDILYAALLYLGIALIIGIFTGKGTRPMGDLLFFVTFSLTVTSSVRMAGVLIVFAILLAPAYIVLHVGERWGRDNFIGKHPLVSAWILGVLVNTSSLLVSYSLDFPTGYTLVMFHSAMAVALTFLAGGKRDAAEDQ